MLSSRSLGATGIGPLDPSSRAYVSDYEKARSASLIKCTAASCRDVPGDFRKLQQLLNSLGFKLIPGWKPISEDGLIGPGTLRAAQQIFPKIRSLAESGFASPASKEDLAVWFYALEFPIHQGPGNTLYWELKEFLARGLNYTTESEYEQGIATQDPSTGLYKIAMPKPERKPSLARLYSDVYKKSLQGLDEVPFEVVTVAASSTRGAPIVTEEEFKRRTAEPWYKEPTTYAIAAGGVLAVIGGVWLGKRRRS